MSIVTKLASSLGRRDELPNQQLAITIAEKEDANAVKELVENLHNKNKDIQNDCIKVLYKIGHLKPKLIAGYLQDLVELLQSRNNRLQWGAMTAIATIAPERPKAVYALLPNLLEAANKGSVITKDNFVHVLIGLAKTKEYHKEALALLNEQLLTASTNQLPMYAENILPIIDESHKPLFIKTLSSRLQDIEKETKRARVEKTIKKLGKK